MKRLAKLLTIFLFVILLLAFTLSKKGYLVKSTQYSTQNTTQQVTQQRRYVLDAKVIEELVNDYREENGLPRLIHDPELCKLAEIRAEEITKDYSHAGIEARFDTFPYQKLSENLSLAKNDWEVVRGWKKSQAHNLGMLDTEVDRTCVATKGSYAVQLFIRY
jgi:uncharacterized protein YkwD